MPEEDTTEWPTCGEVGPEPYPGSKPYLCNREHGHDGKHQAWVDNQLKASWE